MKMAGGCSSPACKYKDNGKGPGHYLKTGPELMFPVPSQPGHLPVLLHLSQLFFRYPDINPVPLQLRHKPSPPHCPHVLQVVKTNPIINKSAIIPIIFKNFFIKTPVADALFICIIPDNLPARKGAVSGPAHYKTYARISLADAHTN